jgi:hypothetical protein
LKLRKHGCSNATLAAVFMGCSMVASLAAADGLERWFVPGELGHEPGKYVDPLIASGREASGGGFLTRVFSGGSGASAREWETHNGRTAPVRFSHNLAEVFPASLYDQHPGFFPLVAGIRMPPPAGRVNWNPDLGRPDVAAHAAEVAREYFSEHSEARSFPLGINDGLIFGESPEVLALIARTPAASDPKWFRQRPDYSNLVFTFMNRAAEDLSRTHPDKYLGALAYYWAEDAPDFPVSPQVLPFLTADRSQGYDPAFRTEELALQERWATAMGVRHRKREEAGSRGTDSERGTTKARLGMYDYLDGPGFLIPRIHTRLIAENIRHAWRSGFTDYYAEGEPNWGLDGPMHWLAAQLLQDPEQPEGRLLDEYYQRYFQAAAEPMRKFFQRCEDQWMHQPGSAYWLKHFRDESQADLFPSAVCRELRALLDEAQRLSGDERAAARVQLVSDAFGATERFIVFQESRDALDRLVFGAGGRKPGEQKSEIAQALGIFVGVRKEFLDYVQKLKVRQPLALAPFEMTDFTNHDPIVNAWVALREGGGIFSDRWRATLNQLTPGWEQLTRGDVRAWREICRDGTFQGTIFPARRIAGLEYGVALPEPWTSRVEPAERHRAVLRDGASVAGALRNRVLRISGTRDTAIFQWNEVEAGAFYLAQVRMNGRVGPSCAATLTFGWLDAQQRNLGYTTMRLPEGEWPAPLILSQGGRPPAGAAYVGVGVRIQFQTGDDWVDVSDLSLKVSPVEP